MSAHLVTPLIALLCGRRIKNLVSHLLNRQKESRPPSPLGNTYASFRHTIISTIGTYLDVSEGSRSQSLAIPVESISHKRGACATLYDIAMPIP
jgi:hypothetical protein